MSCTDIWDDTFYHVTSVLFFPTTGELRLYHFFIHEKMTSSQRHGRKCKGKEDSTIQHWDQKEGCTFVLQILLNFDLSWIHLAAFWMVIPLSLGIFPSTPSSHLARCLLPSLTQSTSAILNYFQDSHHMVRTFHIKYYDHACHNYFCEFSWIPVCLICSGFCTLLLCTLDKYKRF